jgi:integrase
VLACAVQRANAELEAGGRRPLPAGLTPHSLRRTFASLLFAIGEPPTCVMSQMGHTPPRAHACALCA